MADIPMGHPPCATGEAQACSDRRCSRSTGLARRAHDGR